MVLQALASCRAMGLKRCPSGLRNTGLGLCPSTSPFPAACPSLPTQACPPECREPLLAQTCLPTSRPSFLPAYPVPLPASLLPTHLPFSLRSSHLLPLRLSGSVLIYVGYSEPWAAVGCGASDHLPYLSHSASLTVSREGWGFEESRPRGMME